MIKINQQLLGYMNVFESVTKAKVVDAFVDVNDKVVFVVEEGDMGKAIGKAGINIRRLGNMMKKNLRIIEFNNDAVKFVRNIIMPIKTESIEIEDNLVLINPGNTQSKAMLIGRNRAKLNEINMIVKRHFKNIEVKIA